MTPRTTNPKMYRNTVQDVAEAYNLSKNTVRRLTAEGVLPHVRIGRQVRYNLADVERQLASQSR